MRCDTRRSSAFRRPPNFSRLIHHVRRATFRASLSVSPRRSFEEMEAQITAGMKTPVLSCRPGPEGSAGDKGTKRDSGALSRTHSVERPEQVRPSSGWRLNSFVICASFTVLWTGGFDLVMCIMSSFGHKGTLHLLFHLPTAFFLSQNL